MIKIYIDVWRTNKIIVLLNGTLQRMNDNTCFMLKVNYDKLGLTHLANKMSNKELLTRRS